MNAAVLERSPSKTDLMSRDEFVSRYFEMHERESAKNSPFLKAFADGKLTRDQLKRWGMEWYHYNMWMCMPVVTAPNKFRALSRDAFYAKLDNVLGEIGFSKWKAHPYLAADLPMELGATREEVENYIPIPSTIFYMRGKRGADGIAKVGSNIVETDNQRTSSLILDALQKHYSQWVTPEKGMRYFEVHREADIQHTEDNIALLHETCDTREKQESAISEGAKSLRERRTCYDGWMELLK